MEVTNKNYFDKATRMEYFGSTMFKDFLKCPACAIAKINGEYEQEKSKALLMGSYIDAYFSDEIEDFRRNTPELFTKQGVLKSEFMQCENIIQFIKKDEKFMKYLSGEHQVVMTGEIAGVKFKIKIDSYFPGKAIVDQKIMKDINPVWDEENHCKVNFVEYYGYDIQGAIYREVVRQNTGQILPFILAVTTKETVPTKALLQIDSEDLDRALDLVKEYAPTFDKMKKGEIPPTKCGKCDYCKEHAVVGGVKSYHSVDPA